MATWTDIQNRVYFLTKTSSSSFSNADLTLATQRAYERIGALILKTDSKWQFDDSNYTDLPIATASLVSGQQDYSLATTHLTINRIEIKDANGIWHLLSQIDRSALERSRSTALLEYQKTNGTPNEYDLVGNSVFLYPAPNYAQASSLRIYFERAPLLFDYTLGTFTDASGSTSSVPGFNSLFHDLIPLWASYDYALANGQAELQAALMGEIQRKEQDLTQFYGQRDKANRARMTTGVGGVSGNMSGVIGGGFGDSNK